ncbi:MAG: molecular chaperone HtpG [Bacteroidia bacterium]
MSETRKGSISVNTENIFPIIKKSLYSNHEIFLRELVSNAVDASQKLKALASMGEFKGELGEMRVKVSIDKENKTITVSDRGIGLTADEMEKYINQVAFSGATEFVEKYKDKTELNNMIGAFGLGFYSAFMVSREVEIQSLSWQEAAQAAQWTCDGSTSFEIGPGNRTERGTDIILHIAEDSEEFLDAWRVREVLNKYSKFLPIEIEFEEKVINQTHPIWTKKPVELTDEDYEKFYEELYPMAEKPLFWIHLNVDYPFNLTGVLYFPKLKADFEPNRNKIQLYSRQVFITDSVEDIVPDYLRLLHGVIDSPDIPLNVSRSFLQTDANVKKINSHISKKVADKLHEIFKNDRTSFEQKWENLDLFVKYGMLSDEKFYDRAKAFCLYKNTEGSLKIWDEYQPTLEANQRDKDGNLVVLYTSDAEAQHSFVAAARKRAYDVLQLGSMIDSHLLSFLESKHEKTQFKRVDADTIDKLIEKEEKRESLLNEEQEKAALGLFEQIIANEDFKVSTAPLSPDDHPVVVTRSEFIRRMNEMAATGGGSMFGGQMKEPLQVVLNTAHPYLQQLAGSTDEAHKERLARKAYDLALLSQGMLKGEALTAFIERSINIQ